MARKTQIVLEDDLSGEVLEDGAGETVSFEGKHLRVENGRLIFPPVQKPYPPLYFGGSSPAGMAVAAEHCDVYLTWGEPPAAVAEKVDWIRKLAAPPGT